MSTKDDPDAYFKELSVPDVRALEQKTRYLTIKALQV